MTRRVHRCTIVVIVAAVLVGVCAVEAPAQSWGTLKGKFVFDGTPPKPMKCVVTKDTAVCTKHHPMKEDIVVDAKGGLANVVIYVRAKGNSIAVHPDYAKTAKATIAFDNKHCRFEPHVVTLRTGQSLHVKNSDSVGHNTLAQCRDNSPFNVTLPPGTSKDFVFTKPEKRAFSIKCSIHPWMTSWVIVQDHPYSAVTAKDGTFEIANLPAGVDLEFQVWHETAGYVRKLKQDGKPTSWKLGRFKMKLAKGDNDLGDLLVDSSLFK